MSCEKPQTLGIVIFFERAEDGTYKKIGETPPMKYFSALNVYANTPNPASQLVGGDTVEEVKREASEIIKNMQDKSYVEEYVDPYI